MIDKNLIDEDGLHFLRVAIVKQAMQDYEHALRKERAYREEHPQSPEALERWFLGEYGQMLCAGNGETIIRKVRKKVGMPDLRSKETEPYARSYITVRKRTDKPKCTDNNSVETMIRRTVVPVKQPEQKEARVLVLTVQLDCVPSSRKMMIENMAEYLEKFGDTRVVHVQEVEPTEVGGAR